MATKCLTIAFACLLVSTLSAQTTWVEARGPNFTVVTDAGERRARDVAWQFEQVRAAILVGWPWARASLDLPVHIVAARDEASMRRLVPHVFEGRSRDTAIASLLSTAADRYSIVLRSDLTNQDRAGTINPYYASYWSYARLSLAAAFQGELPLWFVNGLAEVLSNTLVTNDHVDFGRPTPWTVSTLVNEPRLRLAELIEVKSDSPYFRDAVTRSRFDAQSWGVMHYLLFGRPTEQAEQVNDLTRRLIEGESSTQAITELFGSIETLERAYLQYQTRPITQFARLQTDARVPRDFPVRTLTTAEALMIRAALHAAHGLTAEAQALVSEARRVEPSSPATYVTDGLLLDRGGKPEEAGAAYERAVELGSDNFYAFYRAAARLAQRRDDALLAAAESHAARAVQLNAFHGPSHTLLARILAQGPDPARGLPLAQRAVVLDPKESTARLALAIVLLRMERPGEARGQALAARALARTPEVRAEAERLIEVLTPRSPPPRQ